MTDETNTTDETNRRRSELVGSAAGVQRAWERLYERLLQLEFDGYAGADAEVFLRAMATITDTYRATPYAGRQPVDLFQQLYVEVIAQLDRDQPRRA